jgi:hypothetical protein
MRVLGVKDDPRLASEPLSKQRELQDLDQWTTTEFRCFTITIYQLAQ